MSSSFSDLLQCLHVTLRARLPTSCGLPQYRHVIVTRSSGVGTVYSFKAIASAGTYLPSSRGGKRCQMLNGRSFAVCHCHHFYFTGAPCGTAIGREPPIP